MKKRVTDEIKLKIMLAAGILLRLYYVVATPVIQTRQYDLGSAVPGEGIFTGHLGYIFYLFTYRGLPDFDPREVYQFFHPPLHHTLSALWMGLVSLFTDRQETLVEWLQVLPLLYSILILFVAVQICKEFGLSGKSRNLVMAVVIFHPSLIFMAGSINNDGLSLLFQFLVIWMALKWYRERSYKHIFFIALSISFGMLTKLSVGMFAVPVAFLFLYVLITEWQELLLRETWRERESGLDQETCREQESGLNRETCREQESGLDRETCKAQEPDLGQGFRQKEKGVWSCFPVRRLLQYLAFGVVCIPIGLSWALRCFLRFDMPLTYVNHLPEQSWQYVGNYSLLERFFLPNPIEFLSNLAHGSLGFGENVWVQLFRTAALGECDLSTFPLWGKFVALFMIALSFVIAVWAFILLIRVFLFGRQEQFPVLDMGKRCFWLIGYAVLFISYLNFCYNFPHQCTMNFRYMVPTVLYPAVAAGLCIQRGEDRRWVRIFEAVTAVYVAVSILTIIVWCIAV